LVHGFVWRMTSRCTKISPKSGRGLGHVTSTIFGSTVGYPTTAWLLVKLLTRLTFLSCFIETQLRQILFTGTQFVFSVSYSGLSILNSIQNGTFHSFELGVL